MRDFKGMKRQRGRNRGGGGGQGQGKPQQNANRAFESNGPDNVKIRGNAQHVFERYQQLARDAASAGDRVLAENYLQHAEHYFRLIRALQPNRTTAEIIGRETFTSGFDIDFEDESGAQADQEIEGEASGDEGEQQRQPRHDRDRYEGRPRDDRPRDDRPRDRQRDDRPRDDRPRDDRPRDDRPRDDRPRDDRPRDDRPREERPEGERREREGRRDRFRERGPREDRPAEPALVAEAPAPAPVEVAEPGHVLRSEDGGVSHAPAFLQPREPRPETSEDAAPPPRARRRRTPRSFEGEAGATPAEAPATVEE